MEDSHSNTGASSFRTVNFANRSAGGFIGFRNPDFWAPLLLVVLGILFFYDPLFSSKSFFYRDILNFHYPLRKIAIEAFAQGGFPLWNPFIYLGQPMLANPNYMAFYPTNLLHLIFPFGLAFKLHFILHPIIGGIGIYFLQRRLGIISLAALGGAVIYQFSGTVLSFMNLYNLIPAVALLPWIGWAFWRSLSQKWLRNTILLCVLLALQIIAFEAVMFTCTLLFLAGLSVLYFLQSEVKSKAAVQICRSGFVSAIFATGLAAIQVLPTLELLPRSLRLSSGYEYQTLSMWSMHPVDLINALIPNFFGNPYTINSTTYWGEIFHSGREGYLVSFFIGGCAFFLVLLSFISSRRKLQLMLAGISLIGIVLALGRFTPVYSWLFDHVSWLRLGRYPSKYFLLSTLALSMMSAIGFEVLVKIGEAGRARRRAYAAVAAVGLALALAMMGYWLFVQMHPLWLEDRIRSLVMTEFVALKSFPAIASQISGSLFSSGIFLLIFTIVAFVSLSRKSYAGLYALLVALLIGELIPANLRLIPLIPDSNVGFTPGAFYFLQQNGPKDPYRVFTPTPLNAAPQNLRLLPRDQSLEWNRLHEVVTGQTMNIIASHLQIALDIPVDGLCLQEEDEMYQTCLNIPLADRLSLAGKLNSQIILSLGEIHDPRLRPLGSFENGSNYPLIIYELKETLPRAYFASGVLRARSHRDALRMFLSPDASLNNAVILEGTTGREFAGQPDKGSVRITEYKNEKVHCDVDAAMPGYLVLLDSYYVGWHAYVDGKEAPILRANYAFRAVEIPAGRHQVEFIYRPRIFYVGLWITLLTSLFIIGAAFYSYKSSSEPTPPVSAG
jgi:hypothetical protein